MIKIAILLCNKMTYECSATGCFNAFIKKEAAFERYNGQDVTLGTVFHCNGCNKDFKKEMNYKFKQLKTSDIETIHLARCVEVECNRYDQLKNDLLNEGFLVVDGSHA